MKAIFPNSSIGTDFARGFKDGFSDYLDNGGPGIREIYHSNYYAAFVLDPDGHNIEVVCHAPE